ncbi:hypothetical protein WN867_08245 [Tetragenococcus halophilus]|uniref:hypothetical protein n=1 Tax=Tetragenococcus halophilus TaxID=51669 RepID=UPI0030C94A77
MDKQEFMEYLEEEYECQVKLWNCDSSDRLQIGKVNLLKEIIDKAKGLDESEKPEIPRWLAERIEEYNIDSSIEFWRYVFNGSIFNPGEIAWILDNDDVINKIFLYGYTIEKESVWVVLKDTRYFHAFTGEYDKFEGFEYVLSMYEGNAHTFADKQKAEAVATLVDGAVKEWSE